MAHIKHPPTRNRRDNIGQVIPFIEKMDEARQSSSCCVGIEAKLETSSGSDSFMKRLLKSNPGFNSLIKMDGL